MATNQPACFREIFYNNGNTPLSSVQQISCAVAHGTVYAIPNTGRPFLPYVGAVLNANGVYMPDTIANNIAQVATFVNLAKAVREASINYVNNLGVATDTIVSEYFSGYLYKKTKQPVELQRYLQTIGIVFDFWTNANPAWTITEYYNALTALKNKLIIEADKHLYFPNAVYEFTAGGLVQPSLVAWKAASANFIGFIGLEFYQ